MDRKDRERLRDLMVEEVGDKLMDGKPYIPGYARTPTRFRTFGHSNFYDLLTDALGLEE